MKKKIKSKISEMNKVKQVVYSQKAVVTKSMLNGSIDFRSAQLALCQIESLILQINQNISNFEQVDKSMIFLKEEISNKRQKEANINENSININNNELINKNDINLTKSDFPDKESYYIFKIFKNLKVNSAFINFSLSILKLLFCSVFHWNSVSLLNNL